MSYQRPTTCQRCGSPIAGIPAKVEVTRVCPIDPQIRRWLTCASCATAIANYLTLGTDKAAALARGDDAGLVEPSPLIQDREPFHP